MENQEIINTGFFSSSVIHHEPRVADEKEQGMLPRDYPRANDHWQLHSFTPRRPKQRRRNQRGELTLVFNIFDEI